MKSQRKSALGSLLRTVAIPVFCVLCLCFALVAVGNMEHGQKEESEKQVEETIKKAVVNCYAIEGRYPATLDYVETYYGLQIDREQYDVFYEVFADNIMPQITVLTK